MIEKQSPRVPAIICSPDTILRLRPNGWFNDELMNAVPGLVEGSTTHILSSFLYDKLEKENFVQADKWVQHYPHDGTRWAFGISRQLHWVGVVMDWVSHSIFIYDPWEEEHPNPTLCKSILKVSSMSFCALLFEVDNIWLSTFRNGSPTSTTSTRSHASYGNRIY
jgi:hypothetical protein